MCLQFFFSSLKTNNIERFQSLTMHYGLYFKIYALSVKYICDNPFIFRATLRVQCVELT